jgi:hypothetical protein
MKMTIGIVFLSWLFISNVYCDDVYIRNGQILRNCHVIETTSTKVRIITSGNERIIPLVTIDKIVISPYDPSKPTIVQNLDGSFQNIDTTKILSHDDAQSNIGIPQSNNQQVTVSYPNMYLLPLSFVAFGLAWDYFQDASLIDGSSAQSMKTRKTILGWTFFTAGILNTAFVLKVVEIKSTSSSLSLVYHF